jgi:hypothetical protein
MYFIGFDRFFLMSAPNTLATITTPDDGKTYSLVVKQGNKVLVTARKIN